MNRHPTDHAPRPPARATTLWALVAVFAVVSQLTETLVDATVWQEIYFWSMRVAAFAATLFGAQWLVDKTLADRITTPAWLKPVVMVSAIALLPFAAIELSLEMHLPVSMEFDDQALWDKSPLLAYAAEYATLASAYVPVHFIVWLVLERRRRPTSTPGVEPEFPRPEFLSKIPGLDLIDVVALKAEEHYVRIFTLAGSELVHYKFGDALLALPPQGGLQVHRSWWVANAHVKTSRRGARRWQLIMADETEVPVSDRYLKEVRARGHLHRKPRSKTGNG